MKAQYFQLSVLIIAAIGLFMMPGCKKEKIDSGQIPTVQTINIVSKTGTSITVSAQVLTSPGSPVIRCGICWSTSSGPNATQNRTEEAPATSVFNSTATGLALNTHYYLRAYAINECGIGYGEQIECRTFGTVTDYDGNTYNTVDIGTQVWMAENLRVTHYRNGDPLPNITDLGEWCNQLNGAYCYYDNNIANVTDYGCLYNWYAVTDTRNLCPEGWHIPSDSDYHVLIDFLGGAAAAGNKMKEKGNAHWISGNPGTDAVYFSARAGGRRFPFSSYDYMMRDAFWWTSTPSGNSDAQAINLNYNSSSAYRNYESIINGFSVRCVKD